MPIKPRNDVVLVKRLTPVYEGKLLIPDMAQEKPVEAVVVAVGPGAVNSQTNVRIPIDLKPGDIVFVGKYAGMEIEEKGEKLLFLREQEIMGKRG